LSEELTQRIAVEFRVARNFHGVGDHGYGPIADVINGLGFEAGMGMVDRARLAAGAVQELKDLTKK